MKRVLFDADGVIVDYVKGYLNVIKQALGKDFTPDQITEFYIEKALNLSDDEKALVRSKIPENFCTDLEPIPGAIEGVQRINSFCDVYIVTSPFGSIPTWASERENWIVKHLGSSFKNKILSGGPKYICKGDFFIDDRFENVEAWNMEQLGTAVLWEHPWNAAQGWRGHRFNDWVKLEKLIQGENI